MSPIWTHIFRREDNSIVYFVRPFSQRPCESQLLKSMNETFYFFIGGAHYFSRDTAKILNLLDRDFYHYSTGLRLLERQQDFILPIKSLLLSQASHCWHSGENCNSKELCLCNTLANQILKNVSKFCLVKNKIERFITSRKQNAAQNFKP